MGVSLLDVEKDPRPIERTRTQKDLLLSLDTFVTCFVGQRAEMENSKELVLGLGTFRADKRALYHGGDRLDLRLTLL